jgi:2-oxoglutarate dehydrogenase E1 component
MPVFHVNGEDIDACLWVGRLAADWIAYSGRDAMVDVVCYRKYGHNEGDDPTFTQPMMYKDIKGRKTPPEIYGERLMSQGVISAEVPATMRAAYIERFAEARGRASVAVFGPSSSLHGRQRTRHPVPQPTKKDLAEIAERLTAFPSGFEPHPKVKMLLERRVQTFVSEKGIDWGFAEVLAFGLLAKAGRRVRLSGQDAGRGTFSQRHLVLHDSNGGDTYQPLQGVGAPVEVFSSVLSEAAVIGYEFGYSSIAKSDLTLWEGQFGDFANGAQVYIDQFLSNSEAKWGQLSGLVLLLPHAFEGQGSEHSSARLERYLQLTAEGNMTVVYPTTAAQYFHLVRQHAYTMPQRPLVVMSPKSLLRLGEATSSLDELLSGSFQPVLRRMVGVGDFPKRVLFCSGKVYYDLLAKATAEPELSATLLVRLEQLYPFPREEVAAILSETKGAEHLWVQEEHRNMGAWRHVESIVREDLGCNLSYQGRPEAASTADGSPSFHARTQAQLIRSALGLGG